MSFVIRNLNGLYWTGTIHGSKYWSWADTPLGGFHMLTEKQALAVMTSARVPHGYLEVVDTTSLVVVGCRLKDVQGDVYKVVGLGDGTVSLQATMGNYRDILCVLTPNLVNRLFVIYNGTMVPDRMHF